VHRLVVVADTSAVEAVVHTVVAVVADTSAVEAVVHTSAAAVADTFAVEAAVHRLVVVADTLAVEAVVHRLVVVGIVEADTSVEGHLTDYNGDVVAVEDEKLVEE
jgi:hypothetical protein